MYTLMQVSKITNISPYTIMHYINYGFFPNLARNENNVKLFSELDIRRLFMIRNLSYLKMPLTTIKYYFELRKLDRMERSEKRLKILQDQLDVVDEYISDINFAREMLLRDIAYHRDVVENHIDWEASPRFDYMENTPMENWNIRDYYMHEKNSQAADNDADERTILEKEQAEQEARRDAEADQLHDDDGSATGKTAS